MTTAAKPKHSKEHITLAAQMWCDGQKVEVIAERLGMTPQKLRGMIDTYRKRFPYRRNHVRRENPVVKPPEMGSVVTPLSRPGCVVRTTITGARVTMPRVEFIDGPEWQARA
ncbi:hypothetical protein G3A56_16110 [Rhizobium oryzihabitans]|uniref:Uncharacterized protein n=1 Tax=Rhizobium oryzihabitans TaxID=2267833 RepID=A0A7L5BDN9_9HYPH|nr:hypothetical protein [Rhizobium oryzihabitans]QIB36946.1 hypothetical protein G3A56_02170 [Rhizobium oryzihabitans]QIB39338.1 hypothetical protein G3A56_16110 [Rhizobium oryzihabitans]